MKCLRKNLPLFKGAKQKRTSANAACCDCETLSKVSDSVRCVNLVIAVRRKVIGEILV